MVRNYGECVDWEDWNPHDGDDEQTPPTERDFVELDRLFAELTRERKLKWEKALFDRMQAALGIDSGSIPTIPLYNLAQLASLAAPIWDMNWIIGRAKMGMINGKWGQFKTFLALDMAIALAGGDPWPTIADKACKQYAVPKP